MKKNSNNPFLSSVRSAGINAGLDQRVATKAGIYSKTLLGIVLFIASLFVTMTNETLLKLSLNPLVLILSIVGIIVLTVKASSNPKLGGIVAIVYSILEGFIVASIALLAIIQTGKPEVVIYVLLTVLSVFIFMYALRSLLPRSISRGISSVVTIAMIAFAGVSFVLMITSFFSPMSNGTMLLYSIIGAIISSFLFIKDFENVDTLVENGVSKDYEWMCALGIISTVIMLFINLLRIVIILGGRD